MTDVPDYKAMRAGDMLNALGDDASKWADAFCQINPDGPAQDVMIGWFANAIEHSNDVRRWRRERAEAAELAPQGQGTRRLGHTNGASK